MKVVKWSIVRWIRVTEGIADSKKRNLSKCSPHFSFVKIALTFQMFVEIPWTKAWMTKTNNLFIETCRIDFWLNTLLTQNLSQNAAGWMGIQERIEILKMSLNIVGGFLGNKNKKKNRSQKLTSVVIARNDENMVFTIAWNCMRRRVSCLEQPVLHTSLWTAVAWASKSFKSALESGEAIWTWFSIWWYSNLLPRPVNKSVHFFLHCSKGTRVSKPIRV